MLDITHLRYEDERMVATFSNFVEYPVTAAVAHPYLYFTLGVKDVSSGFGFLLNDVRLVNGVFQNPYHKTAYRSRSHAYLNPTLAQAVENAWQAVVAQRMPRWSLVEGAWRGLVFDVEKISKAMEAPYKVWSAEKTEQARLKKAAQKVGIL